MKRRSAVMKLSPVESKNELLVTPHNIYLITEASFHKIKKILMEYSKYNTKNKYIRIWRDCGTYRKITIEKLMKKN